MAQDASISSEGAFGDSDADVTVAPPALAIPSVFARLAPALMFAAPLILSLVTYWPRLDDFFALDDFVWLLAVRDRALFDVVGRGFTFPEYTAFDTPTPFFRPLADIGFKLEELAFGLRPAPYHVVNVLLHAAVAGTGAVLATRLSRSFAAGVAVAVVFAVFPAYDVAVTWISQLSELLGASFSLAALLAYYHFLTHDDAGRGRVFLAAAVIAAALAALSKESQITVFVLLPLLAVAVEGSTRSMREIVISFVLLAVLAGVHGGYLIANEYLDAAEARTHAIGWHMFENGWRYLQDMVFPFDPERRWSDEARPLLAAAYLGLGAVAIATRRRAVAFFFLWSVLALGPFVIARGPIQPRYTYLAALPLIACIAVAAVDVVRAMPRRVQPLMLAPAALAMGLFVVAGASETRDRQHDIAVQARNYDLMIAAVRAKCGILPPESTVSIINAGAIDPFGVIVPAAINVYNDRIYASVRSPNEPPPAGACDVDVLRDAPR